MPDGVVPSCVGRAVVGLKAGVTPGRVALIVRPALAIQRAKEMLWGRFQEALVLLPQGDMRVLISSEVLRRLPATPPRDPSSSGVWEADSGQISPGVRPCHRALLSDPLLTDHESRPARGIQ